MQLERKQAVVDKCKAFCKHSSLHGLYYFYKSSSWTVHVIWGAILVASLMLCIFLSHMIWQNYIIDPTFTVVESTRYSMSDIAFPAVAVCDRQFVYGPSTMHITEILSKHGFNTDQIDAFYDSFQRVISKDEVDPTVNKMHNFLADMGYPLTTLLSVIQKPCDVLLVECKWRSKTHDCANMFREVMTINGHCCQFDMNYFRAHAKDHNITFESGVESQEAIVVTYNEEMVSRNHSVFRGHTSLFVFDQRNEISLMDSPITLTANIYYDININVWAIDSSKNVKDLPVHSRKCLLSTDVMKGADNYGGCMSILVLQKVVEKCHCLPFNYTADVLQVDDHVVCSWERQSCVFQTIDKTMFEIKLLIDHNECYQSCDYVQYDTEVKYISLGQVMSKSDEYLGIFAVHFADTTCIKYRREVLYSWDQLLANLGGIFGLCVGGSIISIIELVWFVFDLLSTILFGGKKGKIASKKTLSQKEFVSKLSPIKYNKNKRKLAFVN